MDRTLGQIAEIVDGQLTGDPETVIRGVAPFEAAGPGEVTFAVERKYLKRLDATAAAGILVPRTCDATRENVVRVDDPKLAFAIVLDLFYARSAPPIGVHPSAVVAADAVIGEAVSIGPVAVVEHGAVLGDRVQVHAGAVVGNAVRVGDDSVICANAVILERCRIGRRVIVHAGTVIGSDGFGYVFDGRAHRKIQQTGIVQIDDDVEIGAGNTIDRAAFGKTWIQSGVKTDNLVHIAHNVTVGAHTLLVAQMGIGGSVTIGSHAVIAGQTGIRPHITIGDNVLIGPQSGISTSIPDGQVVTGNPQMPHGVWRKVHRAIPRLPEMRKKMAELERRLQRIESHTTGEDDGNES